MECFLQNPDSSSAHIDVGQICCVPDDVFMITLITRWKEKRCSTHAISQDSCKRDHESGILETNSFTDALFKRRLTARITWWLQLCQLIITRSFKKMLIVDYAKKNSKPWSWLLKKNEKQSEPWCLVCTLNSAILSSRNDRFSSEKNTHTDSSLLLPRTSVAVHVKKVRDEDYVQWLLEFFMNLAHVFKLINSSGDIQC